MYRLRVGKYHGSGGDSLSGQNGFAFSTIDKDNDTYDAGNCAVAYKGAWWYSKCHASNLNGFNYGTSDKIPYASGIVWYAFTTHYYSLKSDIMAVRPMNSS